MINKLFIKNYAIINNLEVDFFKGLTTVTGETGAGKSIILGALNLLLGNRFDSINFKDKTKKTIVEGNFDISNLNINFFFSDNDLDYDTNLIIRREFSFEGKSRAFINDSPIRIDLLKTLGFHLIDIHSQHENLLINNDEFQLNLIDNFSQNKFPEFHSALIDFKKLFNDFIKMEMEIQSKKRKFSHTNFNLDHNKKIILEFESLNPQIDEKKTLESEHKKMTNIHLIKENLSEILFLFDNTDSSITSSLNNSISKLSDISDYDDRMLELLKRLKENSIDLNDIYMDLHSLNHDLILDSNRLQYLEDRINTINALERKLGVSNIEEMIDKISNIKREITSFEDLEDEILKIENNKYNLENKLTSVSESLTLFRKKSAFDIIALLKKDLYDLGMKDVSLEFSFVKTQEFTPSGSDKIILLFSANKGYELKPLSNIASGGEISRLMLCIKKNLFQLSSFSTIIFDEIDSGVSGDIGRKMGRILKNMSCSGQVICITHLPQIASLGNYHFKVCKKENDNQISTSIEELNSNQRIDEIARMLSGDEVNDEAIANARKMIDI